jgi:hypothetical protein
LFHCNCGKEFDTAKGLKLHKARWCDLAERKTFECQCGQVFERLRGKDSLRLHRKACETFKEFRKLQRSDTARDGFRKSMERDPEKIKAIRLKAGKKISKTILSNGAERARRAKCLGDLNKTTEFRQKASETAIKTSARQDVLDNRTAQLARWRENNPTLYQDLVRENVKKSQQWRKDHPEEYYQKCVVPLLSNWKSKPERSLLTYCKGLLGDCRNFFLIHESFSTKTKRRQIDIYSESKHIIVEFDGPLHFRPIFGAEDFESKKRKDKEINLLADKYCIIRVSYDCYFPKTDSFDQGVLASVKDLLLNPRLGLFLFGSKYGEDYQR